MLITKNAAREDGREVFVLDEIRSLLLREHKSVLSFLNLVLHKANELIGSDIGSIGLVEEEGDSLWVVVRDKAHSILGGESGAWKKYIGKLKVGGPHLSQQERSFTGYVAYLKKSRRSGNVKKEKYYRASNEEIKSELAVPILLDGEVLGVINLESKTPNFYTEEHEKILELVAKLIARPLDSLLTREGIRKPYFEVLEQIKDCLDRLTPNVPLSASNVLDKIAGVVAKALNSKSTTIWLLDQAKSELVLRAAHGPHKDYVNQHREKYGETLAWRAISQRCLLKFGFGYPRDRESGRYDILVYGKKLASPLVIVPLLARGEAIGVMKVGLKKRTQDNPQGYYTGSDEQLLSVIQGQIAAAVELKQQEENRREGVSVRLRTLSKLLEIFTDLNLKTVLSKAVEMIPEICHGLNCSIFLWNETRKTYVLAESKGLSSTEIGKADYLPGEGLTGWVAYYGKSLILSSRTPEELKRIHPKLVWKNKHKEATLSPDLTKQPFIAVPIFRDGQSIGAIRVCDRSSGYFTESDEQIMTLMASHISAAITYSDRYEGKLKLLEKLQRLMVLTREFGKLDVGIDEFEHAVLKESAKGAAEVLRTDVLTIYKFNAESGDFETPPIWMGDIRCQEFMNTRIHVDDMPWKILRQGTKYWKRTNRRQRMTGQVPPRDGLKARPRFVIREGIDSAAGIKLEIGGRAVGVLFLNFRSYQPFDIETQKIIEAFASQIALSIEIARLYRQIKESASHAEVNYLAQELHDGVLHILYSGVLNRAGSALDGLRKGDYFSAEENLKVVERAARYCLDECQNILGLMKTHAIDDLGLVNALQSYIQEWVPVGIKVDLTVKKEKQLSKSLERHIYRIIQEALSNVTKHSKASRVSIALDVDSDSVRLNIRDNGVGFNKESIGCNPGQYGLSGMCARVKDALKGNLKIESKPERGTTISAVIPTG